ncbi:MAG TPA: DUF2460 domain-containing protein [Terriglobales bacterium]|nr:DUF2460 domain-containing protein [Terriglobales bacterium]
MSNSFFPQVPGLAWDVKKKPFFNNIIQTPANLRNEVRVAVTTQPQYQFECNFEFLRQDGSRGLSELSTIESFFLARGGNFDSFLIDLYNFTGDGNDHQVTNAPAMVNGDGTTKIFQLGRTYGSFRESVDAVDSGTFQLYVGGVLQSSGYTLQNNTGYVTFTSAPSNGAVITWSGFYYYRVRFLENSYEFNLMQNKLWELQTLTFLQITT